MKQDNFIVVDNLIIKRKNKIEDNYQVLVSNDAAYVVKSSVNYGHYIKSIFSGLGDAIGLIGDSVGLIGGLASEMTGFKFSKMLKTYSDKSSKSKIEKLIKNLDAIAEKKKDIIKIDLLQLEKITIKKGSLLTGLSSVEFVLQDENIKLYSSKRNNISALVSILKQRNNNLIIKSKLL